MSLPMALHGQNQYIVFEPLPGPIPVGGGAPGTYRVVFTLGRPGFPQRPEGKFTYEQNLEGDSHLYARIKPDTTQIVFAVQTTNGAFDFHGVLNRSGNLGKLWTEHVVARDYYDAERIAWSALSPVLSWLSVHLDVPLFVEQVDVIDRYTGAQAIKVSVALPHDWTVGRARPCRLAGIPVLRQSLSGSPLRQRPALPIPLSLQDS